MSTIAQELTKLQNNVNTLATNLTAKGVTANKNEGLTALVAKVANIETGGEVQDNVWTTSFSESSGTATSHIVTLYNPPTDPNYVFAYNNSSNPGTNRTIGWLKTPYACVLWYTDSNATVNVEVRQSYSSKVTVNGNKITFACRDNTHYLCSAGSFEVFYAKI